jgi:hypothetical protein
MIVWIVLNEDTSEILGVFDSRDKGLDCISKNNGDKDCLSLISELIK